MLRRRTLLAIKHIAERSEAAYVTGEQELASLIGGAHGAEVANDNEAERVEALAGKLVENRFLSSRDATILCRVAVQGRRIIEVAPELGVSVDVAKKALQRAKKRLFRQRKRLTIIFRSPPAR